MDIAKYRFDVITGTLTISKAFEKNASTIGSAEQKLLSELIAKYGDALIIERYKTHKVKKGLTFAKMENHIKNTANADEMMKRFERVKQLSKSQKNPYKYVLEWFHDNYPKFAEHPVDDEDFVKAEPAEASDAQEENFLSSNEEEVTTQTEKVA